MSWCNLTCRCGHTDEIDKFCSSEVYGWYPLGHFQCPKCKIAWKVVPNGNPTITPTGFIIPPPNKTVLIEPFLA